MLSLIWLSCILVQNITRSFLSVAAASWKHQALIPRGISLHGASHFPPTGQGSMITSMVTIWKVLLVILAHLLPRATSARPCLSSTGMAFDYGYCLSWRVAVEANNARAWRTVPAQCILYVENYMLGGQYSRDLKTAVDQILIYLEGIVAADDGMDAWVLDIDDTCLSNLPYYRGKRFGGDPFDPIAFRAWALRGACPGIPAVLGVYKELVERGFAVFLLTGRDEEVLAGATTENLFLQGFVGYERLIMRTPAYKGKGAVPFKSAVRKQLVEEGYRIRGNVGDQWSDLLGDCIGDRIFKIPNPMYYVP